MGIIRDTLRRWLGIDTSGTAAKLERTEMKINALTVAEASVGGRKASHPWKMPELPDFFPAKKQAEMAFDSVPSGQGGFSIASLYQWATRGALSEGVAFLGYQYLSELLQRPEYRRITEIYAAEATRKGIKFTGDEERCKEIEKGFKRFKIWSLFRELVEHDGGFGRGQMYIDVGDDPLTSEGADELQTPFVPKAKVAKGGLVGFQTVEPLWSYPGMYESVSPLKRDFYRPRQWYVMSNIVDSSRLFTIIGRQVPDILKPAYAFGGLSLSQMAKPYIDNWLRTRQSVSDLLHSFSTMVLKTNMSAVLSGKPSADFWRRLGLFTTGRDNRGLMAIDKDTEELDNVSTPLGTLDKLLAQSQEQIASVTGIPLVILLGVTPSGLNASSDGEVRSFYATIKAYQERVLREPLQLVIDLIQLDLDGTIDPEIDFEFIDLWEMDEKDKAQIRKQDADLDVAYVTAGVISNEEVRDRITQDEDSPYFGIDLSGPAPEPEDDVFNALNKLTDGSNADPVEP